MVAALELPIPKLMIVIPSAAAFGMLWPFSQRTGNAIMVGKYLNIIRKIGRRICCVKSQASFCISWQPILDNFLLGFHNWLTLMCKSRTILCKYTKCAAIKSSSICYKKFKENDGESNWIFDPQRQKICHANSRRMGPSAFRQLSDHSQTISQRFDSKWGFYTTHNTAKRCDTVVYDHFLKPPMIVEY